GERARPENLADHRGILQEAFALRRQGVESRSDQRLNALREGDPVAVVAEAAVGNEAHELLRIERVAAGPLENRPLHLLRHVLLEEPGHELARLPVRERRQVDRVGVPRSRAPRSVLLEQLGPSSAEEEERYALRPL